MQDIPHPPANAPIRVESLTSGLQIGVSWDALSIFESGDATLLSYNLQIDTENGGNGPWINVQGYTSDDLSTEATIVPLTEGLMYYFQYRAVNAHGWGKFSPISLVLLANRPDTLAGVTTTNVGTDVTISWEVTPFDRWSTVFEYRIKIMRSDGIYIEHASCDG
jgi:hypothetical protein